MRKPSTPLPGNQPSTLHPDTYGMQIDDAGLGLHAPPGSTVIVEPVMRADAGLAVIYLKDAATPAIVDLPRTFHPEALSQAAGDASAATLIAIVSPITGNLSELLVDRIEKIHRVAAIYAPAEVAQKHFRAPAPLPEMTECPAGMAEHHIADSSAYPLVRPGEAVIYDPGQRSPITGALCVLEWGNGARSVLLTNLRQANAASPEGWFVDPVNRASSPELTARRIQAGPASGMLYASDGPFSVAALGKMIVGTVVGILAPRHRPAVALAALIFASAASLAGLAIAF